MVHKKIPLGIPLEPSKMKHGEQIEVTDKFFSTYLNVVNEKLYRSVILKLK